MIYPNERYDPHWHRDFGDPFVLKEVAVGDDAAVVLQQHVAALRQAGFDEITFQLDAGEAVFADGMDGEHPVFFLVMH